MGSKGRPGDREGPWTEARYVWRHYHRFATPSEITALKVAFCRAKGRREPGALADALALDTRTGRLDPGIARALETQPTAIQDAIATRILRDHPHEIVLARCPKCAALLRTPRARQCLACGHDWHVSRR